ncbi:MAG: prolyl oligopeptidase family serine peptidase [Rhodothalassiaceae bacterium]
MCRDTTPRLVFSLFLLLSLGATAADPADGAEKGQRFAPLDVFALEWADDPQFTPDGKTILYLRNGFDIMHDRRRARLWRIGIDGTGHRPLFDDTTDMRAPRLSPDGTRLAYVAAVDGRPQIHVRWLAGGETAVLTDVAHAPGDLTWSPDGTTLAFTMRVPVAKKPLGKMPQAPSGAAWAPPVKLIDDLIYRINGAGYVPGGYTQIFTLPAEGGTPRQLTSGNFNHAGPLEWSPDGKALLFAANLKPDWEYNLNDRDVQRLDVESGTITTLTDRKGPDNAPVISPDGRHIAYLGYEDRYLGFQPNMLSVMDADGTNPRALTAGLDRSVREARWAPDGRSLYFLYDDSGITRLGHVTLDGKWRELAKDIGGTAIGRPYGSGAIAVGPRGRVATMVTSPTRPGDLALVNRKGAVRRLTALNEDLLAQRQLGTLEEIRVTSHVDGRSIEGWILKPSGFDAAKRYPLLLEIHGGPFANYGPRFAAEMQLYAAAGYVVVYANPRGSTSYGKDFGNLIHHAYPGHDYDDLMDIVDAVIARGFVDDAHLYVTGGSGGGVLTAWIVGKTDRFRAAAVQKPVINWTSFALTADFAPIFTRYWFPAMPWEDHEQYWRRSPLSLVGNVKTPTLLITGEADYRTPISETEQFYGALRLRHVDTAMVRIPGANHDIAARPSQLIAKVANVLGWFARHEGPAQDSR